MDGFSKFFFYSIGLVNNSRPFSIWSKKIYFQIFMEIFVIFKIFWKNFFSWSVDCLKNRSLSIFQHPEGNESTIFVINDGTDDPIISQIGNFCILNPWLIAVCGFIQCIVGSPITMAFNTKIRLLPSMTIVHYAISTLIYRFSIN